MNDEQLTQRMRAASEALRMSDSSQARHLEAISAALSGAGPTSDDAVISLPPAGAIRRRRIVASVVAAVMITPAGLAAASESSVPGDALYPVKQISERVLVLFDSDVIARHRIEEIEALEGAGDPDLYEDARQALSELGDDHPLWQRLASATAQGDRDDDQTISDDDDRSEADSAGSVVIELTLPDGAEASFTIADAELVSIDVPSGWMVTGIEDDEATLESDDYIVEVDVLSDGSIDLDVTERDARDDDESEDDDDDDESEDILIATTSTTDAADDDHESSDSDSETETETTSTAEADGDERADDSDSGESDSSDDEREDDDPSESP